MEKSDTVVAIVPAALYRTYRGSGADGHRVKAVAEGLGLPVIGVPISPTGSLKENARTIVEWLQECRYSRILLVSLSKGGADVKMALRDKKNWPVFGKVHAWLNLGGLLEGTSLVPWLMSSERFPRAFRAVNRLFGVDFKFIAELDRRPGGELDFDLLYPPHLRIIHVLGFALPEHGTNWLSRAFMRRLAPLGPNDGFMVLKDCLKWPGIIYPVWGADHYFRTRTELAPLLGKLIRVALTLDALESFK